VKAKKTFEQNLAKFDSKLESSKQQSIITFFQKKTNSENQVSVLVRKEEGLALLLQLVMSYW